MPLILKANLLLGVSTGVAEDDYLTANDHSDELTALTISAKVDLVEVPATGTTDAHARGGAADYSVTLGYLSNDIADTLFLELWEATEAQPKTLFFAGTMRDEAISATNPLWTGVMVVSEAGIGAAAEALSTASATFPLTGAPEQLTTEPT